MRKWRYRSRGAERNRRRWSAPGSRPARRVRPRTRSSNGSIRSATTARPGTWRGTRRAGVRRGAGVGVVGRRESASAAAVHAECRPAPRPPAGRRSALGPGVGSGDVRLERSPPGRRPSPGRGRPRPGRRPRSAGRPSNGAEGARSRPPRAGPHLRELGAVGDRADRQTGTACDVGEVEQVEVGGDEVDGYRVEGRAPSTETAERRQRLDQRAAARSAPCGRGAPGGDVGSQVGACERQHRDVACGTPSEARPPGRSQPLRAWWCRSSSRPAARAPRR